MTNVTSQMIEKINIQGQDVPIVGWMVWWSTRNVDINMEELQEALKSCGIDAKYAAEHNYLATFKRALKQMETQRIIRIISNNSMTLKCQFTQETIKDEEGQEVFDYDRETVVVIDKVNYRKTKNFESSILQCRDDIKKVLVEHFMKEKTRYNSQDITRYVQNILRNGADIISLRDQGCLYYVPVGNKELLESLDKLIGMVSNNAGQFDYMPLPDVQKSRDMVTSAVTNNIENAFKMLEKEIDDKSKQTDTVSVNWKNTRIQKIQRIQERLQKYQELLGDKSSDFNKNVKSLEEEVMGFRVMDFD
jgi:hypothetical protein